MPEAFALLLLALAALASAAGYFARQRRLVRAHVEECVMDGICPRCGHDELRNYCGGPELICARCGAKWHLPARVLAERIALAREKKLEQRVAQVLAERAPEEAGTHLSGGVGGVGIVRLEDRRKP